MTAPASEGSSSFMPHLYYREYSDNLNQLEMGEWIEVTGFGNKRDLAKFVKEAVSIGLNSERNYLRKANDRELRYTVERMLD